MKAMILAAGRGERMRPLTDSRPKPLLEVAGKPLIQHHLENLVAAGFRELVINTSWLGQMLEDFLGDGSNWGCEIQWSHEPVALETAGGILRALPLLADRPFVVVNGDIWTDFPFARLQAARLALGCTAHLVMVDNPQQHPKGDFVLEPGGRLRSKAAPVPAAAGLALTYSGVGIYSADFFRAIEPGKLPLRPLLDRAMALDELGGEHYAGRWCDVGTAARLTELDAELAIP
jgi:MurNAc alpha-1-phosphate uridylyltransferase